MNKNNTSRLSCRDSSYAFQDFLPPVTILLSGVSISFPSFAIEYNSSEDNSSLARVKERLESLKSPRITEALAINTSIQARPPEIDKSFEERNRPAMGRTLLRLRDWHNNVEIYSQEDISGDNLYSFVLINFFFSQDSNKILKT